MPSTGACRCLFVDGRFGSFSSNRLEAEGLKAFLLDAIDTVRTLEPDPARDLPDPARTAKDARTGRELGLYDPAYEELTSEKRREFALGTTVWNRKADLEKGFTLISEEGEYSDSLFDSVVMDSNGLFARHTETSFEIGYEVTVEDPDGNRYASYWWDASPRVQDLLPSLKSCSETAVRRAAAQIGPQDHPGGKCNIVVDSECASKFLTPVLNALGGYAVQQKNSFLVDKAGERVFPECLTILDRPRSHGETGSRLWDSEGVATREMPIIEKGVVKTYFLNSYIAAKMNTAPTIEDARWAAELFNNTFDHFSGDFIADEQIEPLFAAKQLLVARVNNQLAGALHFYEKNRRYWIGHVAVSESSRGNHVGGSLVNHYIAHCHVDDNTRYALWVQRLNQAAVSMYQACGFKYTNRSSLSLIKQK